MCRFGPDKAGNYIEDIMPMTDYVLLCEGQDSDFCQCDEDSIYNLQDGQLESLTGNSSSEKSNATIDFNIDGEAGTTVAALIIAGCAICLVAIAIILLICFIIMKRRSGSMRVENKEEEDIINEYRMRQSQIGRSQTGRSQASESALNARGQRRELVPDDRGFPEEQWP